MDAYVELGYVGLFIISFLAATIIPFSSEGLLAIFVASGLPLWPSILIATLGNTLGGVSTYYLGYIAKWKWITKYLKVSEVKADKTKLQIQKYGVPIAFFTWLPIVGDLIALALGLVKANFAKVLLFMFTGKLARYIVIGYIFINL